MANCIYCGKSVQYTPDLQNWKCNNPECKNPKKEWTIADHKDNQNWAVRHIRALEAQIQQLSESILVLQKKVLS